MYRPKTNAEIKIIQNRLMMFYVVEEAEIARMEAQLDYDMDAEDETELAERYERWDILNKILQVEVVQFSHKVHKSRSSTVVSLAIRVEQFMLFSLPCN